MSSTTANIGAIQQPLTSSASTAVPPSRPITAQSATHLEMVGIYQPAIGGEPVNSSPRSAITERINDIRDLTPQLPTDQRVLSPGPVASHPPRTRQELSFVPEVSSTNFWMTSNKEQEVSGTANMLFRQDQNGKSREKVLPHHLIKSGNMVKVYTGADKDCWGAFAEATQKSIKLEDCDSAMFGYFVDWIYSGSIRCNLFDHELHKDQGKEHFMIYIHLEIFADRYQMDGLSECAVDRWSKCHSRNGQPDYGKLFIEEIKLIYEDCPKTSSLRPRAVSAFLKYYLTEKGQDFAYIGQILSCNSSFARDFASDLKSHQEINDMPSCTILRCSLHPSIDDRRRKAIEAWKAYQVPTT
ncbi:hypothetical protein IFR05_007178 [Cadophora sp. M221]|nr:hypothetical protein IFR05_007178 [Cadophora sp. M221]